MTAEPSSSTPSSTPENTVRELLTIARNWADAIIANDAARIREFVTEDWAIVSASGISPGSRLLDLVASGDLRHTAMTTVGDTRVRVFGNTALLTARITNTAFYRGARTDADEWTTDVFVRRGDRWACALTHYTATTLPDSE